MKQKIGHTWENFLQRRYGVRLGRRYALAAAGIVLMGVLGCSSVTDNQSAVAQPSLPASESQIKSKKPVPDAKVVAASNRFGWKLFAEIWKKDSKKNIFVSPSSVAIALAMTYNGASGTTQQAMGKALELQGISLNQVNNAYSALTSLLENPEEKVQLKIANSLWAKKDFAFKSGFLQRNRDFYQAKITNLDFQDSRSAGKINQWVEEKTQGKIKNIVDTIPANQVLFLINAIYFKGNWTQEFDKKQTANHPFFLASGKQQQHSMMSQSGDFRYYENQQFQSVSLPYGKDGKISMYIFLPKRNTNLNNFVKTLNAGNWDKWMTSFTKREGLVRLPKFKINYEIQLKPALAALGMGEAFTDKANFSAMGKNLAISQVKHKTFVEVNEEGTEAAAATSVGIVATSARVPAEQPFRMIVDRPFFTAIRDNQTGSILFMGAIAEPK
ncbi:serpin family protein [Calothrix sp. 336/3]|uniref:serpin family protein n=1 Tax=Calothrix sp. 336/3 TaxID=1337936 RepID=UPI0004E3332B|nr:serpin family protein [Calothrix sp. 336/3]AKG22396.1 proteinase inhibitor I4 serpin [Calothrix sp. 336/3]